MLPSDELLLSSTVLTVLGPRLEECDLDFPLIGADLPFTVRGLINSRESHTVVEILDIELVLTVAHGVVVTVVEVVVEVVLLDMEGAVRICWVKT